jgi:protein transport protein SEC61 subunit gamma-like protein
MQVVIMNINKESISSFLKQCERVLRVSKKPDMDEYKTVAKVTGIGIIIIGVVGFIVALLSQVLFYS